MGIPIIPLRKRLQKEMSAKAMMVEISIMIKKYRLMKKISQKDFAKLLSATQAQVSLWENGIIMPSKLRIEKIKQLSDGIHV